MSILNIKPELSKEDLLESLKFKRVFRKDTWIRRVPLGVVKISLEPAGWIVRVYDYNGYPQNIISGLSFFEAVDEALERVKQFGKL